MMELAIAVECYAGHRGEETPRRLRFGDRLVEIVDVLDRWLAPEHRYFKVLTDEGVYVLRNDVATGNWDITVFQRAAGPAASSQLPDSPSRR